MSGESSSETAFVEARAVLIDDITKSIIRSTQSMKQLNSNLETIKERGEKIAAVSSAWASLVNDTKQTSSSN